jgi:hypothetical protein
MALTRITTASIGSNVISADKMQNAAIQARHFQTGTITLDLMDANANVAAGEARLNANLDIVQSNVTVNLNSINLVQDNVVLAEANVVAVESRLNSNLDATQSNVVLAEANIVQVQQNVSANIDNFATYANTNLDTKANVSATYFLALANDYATWAVLSSNLNDIQDNVTAIHSGSQQFTTNKLFQQNVTVQGNLIVLGSQVDLGVGTATIDDNFIVVSANLIGTPATDSGIVINRGAEGNVFIGDHISEEGIVFALSQSPHDNTTIAIQEYLDIHANAFHADSSMNFSRTHFSTTADESTGIIIDTTNTHIKFIVSGTEVGNVTSTGIVADSITSGTVELRANDYATYTLLNANLDIIQDNVTTLTTTVDNFGTSSNSNAVALALEDAGLQVRLTTNVAVSASNDYVTYTRLNANVNAVQSNLSTAHGDLSANINSVQTNVAAITGGGTFLAPFVNVNSATGTSNVFFIGRDTASYANILTVTLDGIFQANTEYVANFSNDTIQFTDATIPSGTIVTIFSMT